MLHLFQRDLFKHPERLKAITFKAKHGDPVHWVGQSRDALSIFRTDLLVAQCQLSQFPLILLALFAFVL